MGIVDEDVVRVRDATDLVQIVSSYLQVKRVGQRWAGLCPFHAEKTPSFYVNGELGFYKCFGCQASGDAITFVREIEHLDFVAAVEWLAAKAGISLRYTDKGGGESRKRRARLVDAMATAVAWYHERLLHAPDAGAARGYLRSRGLGGEVVRRYQIGWAPDGFDELARALKLTDDVLRDTGLGFLNRRNRQQDAFRGRVLFPIFDSQGDPVALGGRVLPGSDGHKYKNSAETPLYTKSKVLYGLNWAKSAVVAADEVIVCEGYTDVIGLAVAGVPRAVATCGTALTEEHLRLLRKFARRVVLAFDADAAGQQAAERFYAWERALDLDVAVAALPAGVDPAELGRTSPDALRAAVVGAQPFLGFRVDRALAAGEHGAPEARAKAAEAALRMIREHPSELVRDQYVMVVADRCRLDADQLRGRLRDRNRGVGAVRVAVDRAPPPPRRRDTPETEALRLAIHRPAEMARWLRDDLFLDERNLVAFRALARATTFHEAVERADPGAAELLQSLVVEETDATPDDVASLLIAEAAERALRELDTAVRADATNEAMMLSTWVKQQLVAVRPDSPTRSDAAAGLLAWLGSRSEVRDD